MKKGFLKIVLFGMFAGGIAGIPPALLFDLSIQTMITFGMYIGFLTTVVNIRKYYPPT